MLSELDTTCFVGVFQVSRNPPTGRIGSLWTFLSKLLDISAAQIYSPSPGTSKTSKATGAFGAIRGQKILRKMDKLTLMVISFQGGQKRRTQ
jgi:hypothetical protein